MNLDILLAIAGLLLMLCVFANKISDKYGIPALLIFLGLGMLTGSEGVGRIEFHNARLTNVIGTIALAFILFSGGLDTNWQNVKGITKRGSVLSTAGVLLTAVFLFLFSHDILGLSVEISMLLSVIVSSTDAPAVFSILRSHNLNVQPRLKALLEFESGSNDPMAVFLSMSAIAFISQADFDLLSLLRSFFLQMSLGIILGLTFGFGACRLLSQFSLPYKGLYPVYGVGVVLLSYSLTQLAGGNGFLAVYLSGIVMGNTSYLYRRHIIRFQDSLAWIMQISMFLILGLLVNPNELFQVMPVSFACTIFLIFIARPLAVWLCLLRSDFSLKEQIFIGWAGFKGAVPIILATYPLIRGFPNSQFLFNLIFFMVIISVLFQGKTLAPLARLLRLSTEKPLNPDYISENEEEDDDDEEREENFSRLSFRKLFRKLLHKEPKEE